MDIVLPENPTKKDLVKGLNKLFTDDNWLTYEPFTLNTLKERTGNPTIETDEIHLLALYFSQLTVNGNRSPIAEEIMEWEGKNQYCMHVNLLAYSLMRELAPNSDISFYQGLSEIKTNNTLSAMLFGDTQYGVHAWIEVDGAIVDFSASQFIHSVELNNTSNFILGTTPYNLKFYGKREPQAIIMQYKDRIARSQSLTKNDWEIRLLTDFSTFLEHL